MPSIRKKIGYLPSLNIQEIINKIAKEEKLSQLKVVGLLVEEALIARGVFDSQNKNDLIRKNFYSNGTNIKSYSIQNNDLDEFISDKGITYNRKVYEKKLNGYASGERESYNKELFEQFNQFILFQKMVEEKK